MRITKLGIPRERMECKLILFFQQPFAWDSREYLRKKLIGKQVTFTVENKATNREYGHVYLNEEDVAKTVVSEGWAKAIAPPGAKEARG
jgi:endonuclease YncB( thermonuclease family)